MPPAHANSGTEPLGCHPSALGGMMLGLSQAFSKKKTQTPFFFFNTESNSDSGRGSGAGGWLGTHRRWVLSLGNFPTAPPWQGTTWAHGCIFPQHLSALSLFLAPPPISRKMSPTKKQRRLFFFCSSFALSKHSAPASCQAPRDDP